MDGELGNLRETHSSRNSRAWAAACRVIELCNAPFILWIHDLSALDPYYVLPILMTVTMILQTKMNPVPPDPVQAKVMQFMPYVFSIFFFFFPAGLVLYWITNNVLSIAQQWLINTRMGVPPTFNLPKFK